MMTDVFLDLALDVPSAKAAYPILQEIGPLVDRVKIGKELFTAEGPKIIHEVIQSGSMVFLDLKYHDIPQTVEKAVRAACRHGVSMLNVHCSGGRDMMRAAAESAAGNALVLGVTILTSMDYDALEDVGLRSYPQDRMLEHHVTGTVRRMARVAHDCGLDGVVCSAQEAQIIRNAQKVVPGWEDFLIVTPAIRPVWAVAKDDQKRPTTPTDAVKAGANELVIGRPILKPPAEIGSPQVAIKRIREEIEIAGLEHVLG